MATLDNVLSILLCAFEHIVWKTRFTNKLLLLLLSCVAMFFKGAIQSNNKQTNKRRKKREKNPATTTPLGNAEEMPPKYNLAFSVQSHGIFRNVGDLSTQGGRNLLCECCCWSYWFHCWTDCKNQGAVYRNSLLPGSVHIVAMNNFHFVELLVFEEWLYISLCSVRYHFTVLP